MEVSTCASLWTNKHVADNVAFLGVHNADFSTAMCNKLDSTKKMMLVQDNMGSANGGPAPPCKHCRRLSEELSAWEVFQAQKGTILLYTRRKEIYRVFSDGFAVPDCDNAAKQKERFSQAVVTLADLTAKGEVERLLPTYKIFKHKTWCSRDDMLGADMETETAAECTRMCTATPGCTAVVIVKQSWDTKHHCSLKATDPVTIREGMTDRGSATLHIRDSEIVPEAVIDAEEKYNNQEISLPWLSWRAVTLSPLILSALSVAIFLSYAMYARKRHRGFQAVRDTDDMECALMADPEERDGVTEPESGYVE